MVFQQFSSEQLIHSKRHQIIFCHTHHWKLNSKQWQVLKFFQNLIIFLPLETILPLREKKITQYYTLIKITSMPSFIEICDDRCVIEYLFYDLTWNAVNDFFFFFLQQTITNFDRSIIISETNMIGWRISFNLII